MDCLEFKKRMNDFLFDRIEYSGDLQDFLEHAKNCKGCYGELKIYYNIFRGLGDIEAPSDTDEIKDTSEELEEIIGFYDDYFNKQKVMSSAGKLSIIVFFIMVLCTITYIYLRISGFFN